jgi:hypothetical protein
MRLCLFREVRIPRQVDSALVNRRELREFENTEAKAASVYFVFVKNQSAQLLGVLGVLGG